MSRYTSHGGKLKTLTKSDSEVILVRNVCIRSRNNSHKSSGADHLRVVKQAA